MNTLTDIGIPPTALDTLQPWMAGITISVASLPKLGFDPNSGAEKVLTGAAKEAGKPVVGLETAEEQIQYFAGMPSELQIAFLASTLDQYPRFGVQLNKMIDQWASGEPEALGKTMNDSMRDTPGLAKILLTDRNERWAQWIQERLKTPGTVFLAVGAGHLAGTDSVQAFLTKRGISAVRVSY